jgi:hypothetical protein
MVDALVQHEGIGMVCGYEDGIPVSLSKGGKRNLHTGDVIGEDPLKQYAPDDPAAYGHATIDKRAWQVRRVMDFPHAGDLMVISSVYPDGTVAALEELIGSHGGLGAEQTDAFIFHPPDVRVPDTRNSTDVFHILNAVRGAPIPAAYVPEQAAKAAEVSAWAPRNLVRGLGEVKTWLGRAARALVLDRTAYREVTNDALMTGPALLIALLASLVQVLVLEGELNWTMLGARFGLWFIAVLIVGIAGKLLSGKGRYTSTLRALGFAQIAWFLQLLAFIPVIGPLARLISLVVAFFAVWVGAAEAHETKGWRTIVFPVVAVLVLIAVVFVVKTLAAGVQFTLSALAVEVGVMAQP